MRFRLFLVSFVSAVMLAGSAAATTTTYFVVGNGLGLDSGGACLSTAGTCGGSFLFDVPPDTFPITGSLTYDDVAMTIDYNLSLAVATLAGAGHDGVSEIILSNMSYSVTGQSVMDVGQILGIGATVASITGSYEQSDGISTVVGPAAINEVSILSSINCTLTGGAGSTCGIIIGARDWKIDVGTTGSGDSFDLVNTFNFNLVVPEPGTASLLGFGLLALGLRRTRR